MALPCDGICFYCLWIELLVHTVSAILKETTKQFSIVLYYLVFSQAFQLSHILVNKWYYQYI